VAVAALACGRSHRLPKVKLGLDLKGGVHFVRRGQTDDARLETETSSEQLRETPQGSHRRDQDDSLTG
jgi:preprotein translocase subunit SecD